jgi:hypothetical protein
MASNCLKWNKDSEMPSWIADLLTSAKFAWSKVLLQCFAFCLFIEPTGRSGGTESIAPDNFDLAAHS